MEEFESDGVLGTFALILLGVITALALTLFQARLVIRLICWLGFLINTCAVLWCLAALIGLVNATVLLIPAYGIGSALLIFAVLEYLATQDAI